jgi:hypothetical protein
MRRKTNKRKGGKRTKTSKRSTLRRRGGKAQDPDIVFLSDTLKYYKRNVENQENQLAHMEFRSSYSRRICDALARLKNQGVGFNFPGYNSDSCTEEAIENDESY